MKYTAEIFPVMIASPSDVMEERQIVRDILSVISYQMLKSKGLVLLPLGWEHNTFGTMRKEAQEAIDEQIVDDCELVVAIFKHRIGTKTKHAVSGTIGEIERAIACNKDVIVFFSETEPGKESDANQVQAVLDFKKSCQERGLFKSYKDLEGFKLQLTHDLNNRFASYQTTQREAVDNRIESISEAVSNQIPGWKELLSPEAQEILIRASKADDSYILVAKYIGGSEINFANHTKEFRSDRQYAPWKAALKMLVNHDLIEQQFSTNGESYSLTEEGFKVADLLSNNIH